MKEMAIAVTLVLVPMQADAQEADVPQEPLGGDIVVTAQRRAQNLQDVSVAISALDQNELARSNITSVADLGARIPNVSIGTQQGQANIFIRGIGLDNNFTGADPSVALHVDGAVISQSNAQMGSFLDLDRIEVLRGPQGTLYGRNATGGAINLITNRPTRDLAGYVRGTVGDYGLLITEAAIGGPLVGDRILARVAVRTEDRDGYGVNELTGQEIDDAGKRSARLHLLFNATERVSLLLTGEWHREHDAAYAYKFREISYPPAAGPALAPVVSTGFALRPRNIRSEGLTRNDRETWAVTGTLNIELSDAFTLRSTTNYRENRVDPLQDLDTSSIATASRQNNYSRGNQFSSEIQLAYAGADLNGLVAAYYFKESLFGDNSVGLNPGHNLDTASRNIRLSFAGSVDIESWALFGQGTYDLTEQLALTLGGRLTHERREGDSIFSIPPANLRTPFHTAGEFTDFSPRATLEWRPVDGVMLYGTYARGFKSGIILTGQLNPILEPEKVENLELGLRSEFFDRSLTLNLTGFRENFTNLQVGKASPGTTAASIQTIFENAASAVIDGIELEMSWRTPLPGIRFDFSGGWLDARFEKYSTAEALDLPNAVIRDLAGNRLSQSPRWNASARAEYSVGLASGATISIGGDLDYRSRIYFSASNLERLSQRGRTLYNANLQYRSPGNRFSVSLWGRNLSDELVATGVAGINTSRLILATYAPPLTYGITAGFNF